MLKMLALFDYQLAILASLFKWRRKSHHKSLAQVDAGILNSTNYYLNKIKHFLNLLSALGETGSGVRRGRVICPKGCDGVGGETGSGDLSQMIQNL